MQASPVSLLHELTRSLLEQAHATLGDTILLQIQTDERDHQLSLRLQREIKLILEELADPREAEERPLWPRVVFIQAKLIELNLAV